MRFVGELYKVELLREKHVQTVRIRSFTPLSCHNLVLVVFNCCTCRQSRVSAVFSLSLVLL